MAQDLTGQRFGRLVVISPSAIRFKTKQKMTWWRCRCDCGEETITGGAYLMAGKTKSCGCLRRETSSKLVQKIRRGAKANDCHA